MLEKINPQTASWWTCILLSLWEKNWIPSLENSCSTWKPVQDLISSNERTALSSQSSRPTLEHTFNSMQKFRFFQKHKTLINARISIINFNFSTWILHLCIDLLWSVAASLATGGWLTTDPPEDTPTSWRGQGSLRWSRHGLLPGPVLRAHT